MARYERFTFMCDSIERQAITELAIRLQGSQSDAVRFIVIEAVRQLTHVGRSANTLNTQTQRVQNDTC